MTTEVTYKVEMLFGWVHIDSFFRFENGALVGYGRATHYDRNGKITKVTEGPTGISVTFG